MAKESRYYLVFAARALTIQDPAPVVVGNRSYEYQQRPTGELAWASAPVGLYYAESPEEPCRAGAQKTGAMGTFFAVEGTPWGVSLIDSGGAEEIGFGGLARPELSSPA